MKKIVLAAVFWLLSVGAQASTLKYSFAELVMGDGGRVPYAGSVATLEITEVDSFLSPLGLARAFNFTLTNTFDFDGSPLSDGAKTKALRFSGEGTWELLWPDNFAPDSFQYNISKTVGLGPAHSVVFKEAPKGGFETGESASWTVYGASDLEIGDFKNFRLKVIDEGESLYFAAALVPEPESYALMLAGLGVIGTMVRRRQAKPL